MAATGTKMTFAMKDVMKLATIFGSIAAGLTWIHAEVTIPHILAKAEVQIERAIDRHAVRTHASGLTQREFRLWAELREKSTKQMSDQLMRRLERIEEKLP